MTFGTASLAPAEILIGMPGPLTGGVAWFGEQMQEGIGMKVAELNAAGGVLGQQIALLPVDDYCDPEQAVAAARKLVEAQVDAVIGHLCSGAAIPASRIYEDAGILFFGSSATNPKLTDQGFRTVFRIAGRDTRQGVMAADYLAKRWSDHNIAIVHDGGAYGLGVAEAARRRLSELGVASEDLVHPG
jgi:branched-chain amino acid transport system substrate-binding protein